MTDIRVVQFLIGSFGGAERFFVRLCAALEKRGVSQLLLINDHPELVADVEAAGLRHQIFTPSKLNPIDRHRVTRAADAFGADIVMAWMNRAARRLPAKRHFVNVGRLGGYYPVKNYRRCHHLVGNTPAIVESSIAQGWPADRIRMISNFTDPLGDGQVGDGKANGIEAAPKAAK